MVNCVGQAYDGASNMARRHSGCATIIQNEHPTAIYVHCKAHLLNLALMKACTSIKEISKFFVVLFFFQSKLNEIKK